MHRMIRAADRQQIMCQIGGTPATLVTPKLHQHPVLRCVANQMIADMHDGCPTCMPYCYVCRLGSAGVVRVMSGKLFIAWCPVIDSKGTWLPAKGDLCSPGNFSEILLTVIGSQRNPINVGLRSERVLASGADGALSATWVSTVEQVPRRGGALPELGEHQEQETKVPVLPKPALSVGIQRCQ